MTHVLHCKAECRPLRGIWHHCRSPSRTEAGARLLEVPSANEKLSPFLRVESTKVLFLREAIFWLEKLKSTFFTIFLF